MRHILTAELDALETERRAMDLRRPIIDAQSDMLRRLIARLDEEERVNVSSDKTTHTAQTRPARTEEVKKGSKLSGRWGCVVKAAIRRYPGSIKNGEAPAIQTAAGEEPGSREQVRTHVWVSTRDGLYEKMDKGSFRATARAAEIFNIPLGTTGASDAPHESETPNSSELSGVPKTNGIEPLNL
jgi:hypothetical protein